MSRFTPTEARLISELFDKYGEKSLLSCMDFELQVAKKQRLEQQLNKLLNLILCVEFFSTSFFTYLTLLDKSILDFAFTNQLARSTWLLCPKELRYQKIKFSTDSHIDWCSKRNIILFDLAVTHNEKSSASISNTRIINFKQQCKNLHSLQFSHWYTDTFTQLGFSFFIKHCHSIETLSLKLCDVVTNYILEILGQNCTNQLTFLEISCCDEIFDVSLKAFLQHAAKLKELKYTYPQSTRVSGNNSSSNRSSSSSSSSSSSVPTVSRYKNRINPLLCHLQSYCPLIESIYLENMNLISMTTLTNKSSSLLSTSTSSSSAAISTITSNKINNNSTITTNKSGLLNFLTSIEFFCIIGLNGSLLTSIAINCPLLQSFMLQEYDLSEMKMTIPFPFEMLLQGIDHNNVNDNNANNNNSNNAYGHANANIMDVVTNIGLSALFKNCCELKTFEIILNASGPYVSDEAFITSTNNSSNNNSSSNNAGSSYNSTNSSNTRFSNNRSSSHNISYCCPELECIKLVYTEVTDLTLIELGKLEYLKEFALVFNRHTTDKGMISLLSGGGNIMSASAVFADTITRMESISNIASLSIDSPNSSSKNQSRFAYQFSSNDKVINSSSSSLLNDSNSINIYDNNHPPSISNLQKVKLRVDGVRITSSSIVAIANCCHSHLTYLDVYDNQNVSLDSFYYLVQRCTKLVHIGGHKSKLPEDILNELQRRRKMNRK